MCDGMWTRWPEAGARLPRRGGRGRPRPRVPRAPTAGKEGIFGPLWVGSRARELSGVATRASRPFGGFAVRRPEFPWAQIHQAFGVQGRGVKVIRVTSDEFAHGILVINGEFLQISMRIA